MSYVSFVSGSRTLTMSRVIYTIGNSFSQDESGRISISDRVEVRAKMRRLEINSAGMISYDRNGGDLTSGRIMPGTLVFYDSDIENPYLSIDNIYIMSISEDGDTWREWGDVTVSFSNEGMDRDSNSTLIFNNIVIYNASINIIPSIRRKDVKTYNAINGSYHQTMGYDFVRINISGNIVYDSCEYPEMIVSAFEIFEDISGVTMPVEKKLSEFIPNLRGADYDKVFIENATLTWQPEKKIIALSLSMIGPDQQMRSE